MMNIMQGARNRKIEVTTSCISPLGVNKQNTI